MGIKIIDSATALIENTMERSSRDALKALRDGADQIAELARQMAPVDEGNLEDAIVTEEDRGGINRRTRITVGIDDSHPAKGGKTVGEYAYEMHELLYPGGHFKLGKKSQEKQEANPNVQVGGMFIERSAEELEDEIVKNIQAALSKLL